MSTELLVSLRGLMRMRSIELYPTFNGSLEGVKEELRKSSPCMDYVEDQLQILTVISIPSIARMKPVTIVGGDVLFKCSDKMLQKLCRYCESMNIKYKLGERS